MRAKLFLLSIFFTLSANLYSQYKQKYFIEEYIIRQDDTIECKIYSNNPEELQEKIIFQYTDSDEPIVYYPGSIIKSFGLSLKGKYNHYTTVPRPLNKKGTKTELIFGEVITNGFLKLYKYSFTKEQYMSSANLNGTIHTTKNKKVIIDYFLCRSDIDSSSHLSSHMDDTMIKLNKELINHFFGDNPDLLKKIEHDVTLALLSQYIEEYNSWYTNKNKKD